MSWSKEDAARAEYRAGAALQKLREGGPERAREILAGVIREAVEAERMKDAPGSIDPVKRNLLLCAGCRFDLINHVRRRHAGRECP